MSEGSEAPQTITTYADKVKQNEFLVPKEKLSSVGDVTMSFWVRASYTYPRAFDIGRYATRYTSLGHVSETGNSERTITGSRTLALWLSPLNSGKA